MRSVALSSTTSTDTPRRSGSGSTGSSRSVAASVWTQIVNQKVLPLPSSLSTPQSPPMSDTSWLLIARPRPVPPYRRDVEVSACTNGWNTCRSICGAMPMPVSETSKRITTLGIGGFRIHDANDDLTRLRELDRVADEVGQHLAHATGVAPDDAGDRPLDDGHELEALGLGRPGQEVDDVADDVADPEVDLLDLQLAGFDLREVEDVVDDRQQRLARVPHRLRVVALAGVEIGLEQQVGHADDAVHRRADLVAHVGQEVGLQPRGLRGLVAGVGHRRFGAGLGRDVGEGPDPTCVPTVETRDGLGGHEHDARGGAGNLDLDAMAELGLSDRVGHPDGQAVGCPRRVHRTPDPAHRVFRGDAGDLAPTRIRVHVAVLGIGLEDADRRGVGQQPELVGRGLHLSCSDRELLGADEQVREHGDLGPELVRWHGREDEVDRALGVEVTVRDLVAAVRRDEDQRSHLGLLALADQRCGLEAVHPGHADVEEDDRELPLHHAPERVDAGLGFDDLVAERQHHGLQGEPLGGHVVDDEDGHRGRG